MIGTRWKDIDLVAQRIRVRNAWVRGKHSGEGKSDLSTRRSVPLSDRLARELKKWRLRTVLGDDDDLVFAGEGSRPDRSRWPIETLARRHAATKPELFRAFNDELLQSVAQSSWTMTHDVGQVRYRNGGLVGSCLVTPPGATSTSVDELKLGACFGIGQRTSSRRCRSAPPAGC